MSTIVFSNQKGGIGKTTLTRELGIYLAGKGYRVLLVDTDPQGNLSKSLTDEHSRGLYEALAEQSLEIAGIKQGLHLLAGDYRLSLLEKSLVGELDCYTRLKRLFQKGAFRVYDHILIDTPPSLGVLTINALTASQYLTVPMNPSLYSMQGANDLFLTVSKVRENLNPYLYFLGVIINAFDSIPVITRQIKEEITASFGDKVFAGLLSKSIKLEESIALKQGVIYHKNLKSSRVKEEVEGIGEELLARLKQEAPCEK